MDYALSKPPVTPGPHPVYLTLESIPGEGRRRANNPRTCDRRDDDRSISICYVYAHRELHVKVDDECGVAVGTTVRVGRQILSLPDAVAWHSHTPEPREHDVGQSTRKKRKLSRVHTENLSNLPLCPGHAFGRRWPLHCW